MCHLAAALGLALVENDWRALFTRTTDLLQKLQIARCDLALEAAVAKLDKYHLLVLDDLANDSRRKPASSSSSSAPDSSAAPSSSPPTSPSATGKRYSPTLAAIDRLVRHATTLEMNARKLSAPHPARTQAGTRPTADARDNQHRR
jgi:hypothetical protein